MDWPILFSSSGLIESCFFSFESSAMNSESHGEQNPTDQAITQRQLYRAPLGRRRAALQRHLAGRQFRSTSILMNADIKCIKTRIEIHTGIDRYEFFNIVPPFFLLGDSTRLQP
jgi:hypothetical protein